jgi:tRNA-specific 2-thiouridylase
MSKVVIGISGGVDSSIAAYLLKQQGFDVAGLFMINWHDTTGTLSGDCPWHDDLIFAQLVARKLDIPLYTFDFSDQYRKRVVDYMFAEYKRGRTPNPDVLCNREIKFDLFLKKAKELGADYIATGHYCKKEYIIINRKKVYRLLSGSDPSKEQSYFLCQLNQKQLAPIMFPIGHLYKSDIRRIAAELELPTAKRKDSQGICFVGKINLPEFLKQKLIPREGDIIEIDKKSCKQLYPESPWNQNVIDGKDLPKLCSPYGYSPEMGKIIGKHRGAHYYTIGQRKGLNIGGKREPLFVLKTDTENNLIYVGQGHDHPGLNRFGLFIPVKDIHWIREDLKMKEGEIREYKVRIRYRQSLQKATLHMQGEGLYVLFKKAQRGITSGQFAAWYHNTELLGSGAIE